jgi:hypothetical protein
MDGSDFTDKMGGQSAVPSGLRPIQRETPTLKGWAIFEHPCGMRPKSYAFKISSQPLRYAGRLMKGAASGALVARRCW